jgi:DNA recombination protein RmuC
MKIEDRAKEIIQYLGRLQAELVRFREDFGLLGRHIGHAQSCYQNTEKRLERFAEKLLSAESGPTEVAAPASSHTEIA